MIQEIKIDPQFFRQNLTWYLRNRSRNISEARLEDSDIIDVEYITLIVKSICLSKSA
jgi:hypothetical protein